MVAYAVLVMAVIVAGGLLASVLVAAIRGRQSRRHAADCANGDVSWLPGVMTGDGNDGCASSDAGCDGGGGGGGD